MPQEQRERIYKFADSFINEKSYRNYDEFITVEELVTSIQSEFNLPFVFYSTNGNGLQILFWSSKLGHYVLIDGDWYLPFENTYAFIDSLEATWKETERIELLLEQIKV